MSGDNDGGGDEGGGILLMLRDDGSFVQYGAVSDDDVERRQRQSRSKGVRRWKRHGQKKEDLPMLQVFQGTWNFDGKELILASDRPQLNNDENGDDNEDHHQQQQEQLLQVHDTMFSGEVSVTQINEALSDDSLPTDLFGDEEKDSNVNTLAPKADMFLSVLNGVIGVGKFMYPKDHPSFFEKPNAPIFRPQQIGAFELRQLMGALNAFNTEQSEEDAKVEPRFQPEDFYGKKFLLTSEPIQMKRAKPKLKWSKRAGGYVKEKDAGVSIVDQQPFDLRVMPIEFFKNNTFQAIGSGKILRGRFGLEGSAQDKLWFAVSLFGAGRSAPGSVFSEGPGLTHEDERSYFGDIELWERSKANNEGEDESGATCIDEESKSLDRAIFVEGAITVGQDMGTDTRAIPVARFTMREVIGSERSSNVDEDYRDEESIFE